MEPVGSLGEEELLSVRGLKTYFHTRDGVLKAVDDVSFNVKRGETFGIVGESGCGKSIACLSILHLVASPPGNYEGGEILFNGRDTLKMNKKEIHSLRGGEISIIFQEPMTALNPVYTVGNQLEEAIQLHQKVNTGGALQIALDWLSKVRIPNPETVLKSYPFTLSGGMRQRVMIAMALACHPKLLIADEPTTALDVTIQAQILNLINAMKQETDFSCIFITHDLAVISEMADRVMVMYSGKVCETAATNELIVNPLHPYTQGLIKSRPRGKNPGNRLTTIPGNVPSLRDKPPGCPFHPRCQDAFSRCAVDFPPHFKAQDGHTVFCWKYAEGEHLHG
jgi:peptide/nickel transport system ATP-binding protein/oligopeptide transport system ATP-binding protein